MRGTARVEFFPKKDMRVVLSIGPNSQDWLLCDIDVSMVGTLPTNWKDLSKSITTVSKECDTILAACLKR